MKLDKQYSRVEVCPNTGIHIRGEDLILQGGMCLVCGEIGFLRSHANVLAGKWLRPTFSEWLCGKRKRFITKDELDNNTEGLSHHGQLIYHAKFAGKAMAVNALDKNGNPVSCEVD